MDEWADIVRQYSPLVRKTAYRLLGNGADAADCLQEVFLNAIRSYRPNDVRSWLGLLRRLTTCRAVDMLRQRLREAGRVSDLADWTAVPCTKPGPGQAAEDRELAAQLRLCLAQLPAQQAEVFCLACVEDLGHDEIAEHLGLAAGNVRVLLHRARARLRKLLPAPEASAER